MSGDDIQFLRMKLDQLCDGVDVVRKTQEEARVERQIILTALKGDEYGTPGLVHRVERQEKKIDALEKKTIRWSGIVVGISIAFGILKDNLLSFLHLGAK